MVAINVDSFFGLSKEIYVKRNSSLIPTPQEITILTKNIFHKK